LASLRKENQANKINVNPKQCASISKIEDIIVFERKKKMI
jgi:hypothetical protein